MKVLSKLKLLFTPTDEYDAVNKKYVDEVASGSNNIDLSNYLAKDNSKKFNPTEDYQPATKKYVDDTVSDAIGDLAEILDSINRTVI